jgi:hypothetical protein
MIKLIMKISYSVVGFSCLLASLVELINGFTSKNCNSDVEIAIYFLIAWGFLSVLSNICE